MLEHPLFPLLEVVDPIVTVERVSYPLFSFDQRNRVRLAWLHGALSTKLHESRRGSRVEAGGSGCRP